MKKELIDQWASISKNAIDSMQELAEINMKIVAKLAEQQQQILSTCLKASAKEMELIAGAKDPKGLLASQAHLAAEYNKKLVDIVRNTTETLTSCKSGLSGWVGKTRGRARQTQAANRRPLRHKARNHIGVIAAGQSLALSTLLDRHGERDHRLESPPDRTRGKRESATDRRSGARTSVSRSRTKKLRNQSAVATVGSALARRNRKVDRLAVAKMLAVIIVTGTNSAAVAPRSSA